MVALAQVRLREQCVDAHLSHDPARSLLVDGNPVIAFQDRRDRPMSPGRFVRVDPIDEPPDSQLHVVNQPKCTHPVNAGPIEPQKLALPLDRDPWIILVNQSPSLGGVEEFGSRHLFFHPVDLIGQLSHLAFQFLDVPAFFLEFLFGFGRSFLEDTRCSFQKLSFPSRQHDWIDAVPCCDFVERVFFSKDLHDDLGLELRAVFVSLLHAPYYT